MCTIIIAFQVFKDSPVFIASNRDEFLDRPSTGFRRWTAERQEFLAPVDRQAGGTWIGVNHKGLFAGITNRYGDPPDRRRSSRGKLVPMALNHNSVVAASQSIKRLNCGTFNPFHLVLVDRQCAKVLWSDGTRMHEVELSTGYSLITEQSYGAKSTGRERLIEDTLGGQPSKGDLVQLLARPLGDNTPGALISIPSANYGTRSSSIIEYGLDPHPQIRHTTQPPNIGSYDAVHWPTTPLKDSD